MRERGWSPGREVVPCLTCQAGLCAEHGAPRTETTTGGTGRECYCGHCEYERDFAVSAAPAPPAAEPAGYPMRVEWYPVPLVSSVPVSMPPVAEPGEEMSREEYRRTLSILINEAHERGAGCASTAVESTCGGLVRHDASLRARAERERQRAEAEKYMRGVNQRASEHAEAAVAAVRRERDEAREQRAHSSAEVGRLGLEVARLRDDFAAATKRAAGAEADQAATHAENRDLRARLATAEAEVARLRDACEVADTRRDAAAEERDDVMGDNAALRDRIERLVEAGDVVANMAEYHAPRFADGAERLARWAAARGEKGGA